MKFGKIALASAALIITSPLHAQAAQSLGVAKAADVSRAGPDTEERNQLFGMGTILTSIAALVLGVAIWQAFFADGGDAMPASP